MRKLIEEAKKGGVFKWNYKTQADATGYKYGSWQQVAFHTLYTYCLKAIHEISENLDDQEGNILIASPSAVDALEAIDGFEVFDYSEITDLQLIGKIGRFVVYRDMFATEDYILVGKTKEEILPTLPVLTGSRFIEIIGLGLSGLN
jgi:hypothetical protein